MNMTTSTALPFHRGFHRVRLLAISAILSVGFAGAALADVSEMDARLAITRAQAKIDLVAQENPASTQNMTFANAQQKLVAANAAIDRDKNQQAAWLAEEAELMADNTAGASKLAGLERTRSEIARDVEILEFELRKQ